MIPWRTIEAEIEAIAREQGFKLDTNKYGDKIIDTYDSMIDDSHWSGPELNLTTLAQELAQRLEVKAS